VQRRPDGRCVRGRFDSRSSEGDTWSPQTCSRRPAIGSEAGERPFATGRGTGAAATEHGDAGQVERGMTDFSAAYTQLIQRFAAWAHAEDNIRTAIIVGSRARTTDHPADAWSDLDVLLFCRDPAPYKESCEWLKALGEVWTTFLEPTPDGRGYERRALIGPGLDLDVVPIPVETLEQMIAASFPPDVADIVRRGARVLVDKDGYEPRWRAAQPEPPVWTPPDPARFLNLVNDFWFHTVWTAKKLRRGELWWGKSCCDSYLKNLVREVLEWHARLRGPAGLDTWMRGRFLEEWIDPRARAVLPRLFARYDEEDIWRALVATADLFRWLSRETAQKLGVPYPDKAERETTQLVLRLYGERGER
jgi:aminoglycoside 6-adenylyltransferase